MSNADIVLKWAFDRLLNGATKVTKAIHSSLKATILVLAGVEVSISGSKCQAWAPERQDNGAECCIYFNLHD